MSDATTSRIHPGLVNAYYIVLTLITSAIPEPIRTLFPRSGEWNGTWGRNQGWLAADISFDTSMWSQRGRWNLRGPSSPSWEMKYPAAGYAQLEPH
jgi:hypothetical protein